MRLHVFRFLQWTPPREARQDEVTAIGRGGRDKQAIPVDVKAGDRALLVAADDQQFLAGRGVPARRVVVHAAIARIHAIDNGVPQRSTALDDPPAHVLDVIVSEPKCQCASVDVRRSPHCRKRIGFNHRLRSTESHVRIIIAVQRKLGENSKFTR
jgi:hypothetical protein